MNLAGMVYSARGNRGGRTQQERLRQKFISGEMSTEEQQQLAAILVDTGQKIPEAVWVHSKILGKPVKVPYKEFIDKWQPLGYIALRYE